MLEAEFFTTLSSLTPGPQIGKLREQAEEQESSLKAQEEEVNCKKRELEVLVEEEAKLGADIKKSQREIESLIKGLEDVEDLLNEVNGILYCLGKPPRTIFLVFL